MQFFSGFFLNPQLLGLAGLVSVPIIIYLINRHRYRRRKWAAMQFLLKALKRSQRRLQIQNLLLLIIRCLVILLLALAVARPVLNRSPLALAPGGGKNWILVLDTSFSMDYRDGPRSLLDQARETMMQMVDEMVHPDDHVAVMTLAREPRVLLERSQMTPANRKRLETELRQVAISYQGLRLVTSLRALEELAAQFAGPAGRPEPAKIVFFSDLQRKDWLGANGPRSPEIRQTLARLQDAGSELVVAKLSSEPRRLNVAVTGLEISPELVSAGVPVEIRVTIENFGDRDAEHLDLSLRVDPPIEDDAGEAQLGEVLRVPAGSIVTRALPFRFDEAGFHTVVAEVRSDGLVVDNRRFLVVRVAEQVEVLLVDGEPALEPLESESFYVAVALEPRDDSLAGLGSRVTPFRAVIQTADLLAEVDWQRYAVVVLANVTELPKDELSALERYVEEGGALIVFLGSNVRAERYNEAFHKDGDGLLPLELVEKRGDSRTPVYLEFADRSHPVALYFEEHEETTDLHKALVPFYYFMLARTPEKDPKAAGEAPRNEPRILCRYNDIHGSPAIFDNAYGRGRVMWVTSSADDDWNEFPAWQDYVVFLYESISYLTSFRQRTDNLDVDEPFRRVYESSEYAFEVLLNAPPLPGAGLGGIRTIRSPMQPAGNENRFQVIFDGTDVPGLYRLDLHRAVRGRTGGGAAETPDPAAGVEEPDGSEEARSLEDSAEYFAVNVRTEESDLEMMTAADFKDHFEIEPEVLDFSRELRDLARQKETLRGYELWMWCLGAVIGLLFLETALAQFFGRRAR